MDTKEQFLKILNYWKDEVLRIDEEYREKDRELPEGIKYRMLSSGGDPAEMANIIMDEREELERNHQRACDECNEKY